MLSVRKARESDLELFLEWRNDPAVVAASFTPGRVEMEHHRPWFLSRLAADDCSLYVVDYESVPAGQVRFDIEGADATINYSLAAAFRGRGLATHSVATAIDVFRSEHREVTTLIAYVKADNVASCRVFEKLDFGADGFDSKRQANRYHKNVDERQLHAHPGDN